MEITARELRDVEIREAFRGYHRDDVNDLLERAAATIDAANERVRQMSERLGNAQAEGGRSRETEDILHRTLLLAQRAADEAVAEAQAKARPMVEDAEVTARRTVADAEAEARRRGESERRRIEQEVLEMSSRRDALQSDIDVLNRYESEYRDRLLRALETDLETLRSRPAVAPGPAPSVSAVEIPASGERIVRRDDSGPATREIDMRALVGEPEPQSMPTPAPSMAGTNGSGSNGTMGSNGTTGSNGVSASAPSTTTAGARTTVVTEERSEPTTDDVTDDEAQKPPAAIDLLAAESAMEAEVLDDEAFFATLREAVHDDAPLGPREDDQSSLFDQDDDEQAASFKDVFRRRR
jgi:DivIVA domain-containing protein